ncbi:hypothetical protein PG985_009741 [Apiospora marii]|uniref:uncharacterized protein n=1 Tax=Apiospora marii TaxID=335849 RepID=UPI003131FE10
MAIAGNKMKNKVGQNDKKTKPSGDANLPGPKGTNKAELTGSEKHGEPSPASPVNGNDTKSAKAAKPKDAVSTVASAAKAKSNNKSNNKGNANERVMAGEGNGALQIQSAPDSKKASSSRSSTGNAKRTSDEPGKKRRAKTGKTESQNSHNAAPPAPADGSGDMVTLANKQCDMLQSVSARNMKLSDENMKLSKENQSLRRELEATKAQNKQHTAHPPSGPDTDRSRDIATQAHREINESRAN